MSLRPLDSYKLHSLNVAIFMSCFMHPLLDVAKTVSIKWRLQIADCRLQIADCRLGFKM